MVFPSPFHILLGLKDDVVPLSHVLELIDKAQAKQIDLTLIKNGDHSLSQKDDLALLERLAQRYYAAL